MQYPQCLLYFLLSAYGIKIVVNHVQNYVPWKRPRPKLVGNCYIVFTSVFPIIHCATSYTHTHTHTHTRCVRVGGWGCVWVGEQKEGRKIIKPNVNRGFKIGSWSKKWYSLIGCRNKMSLMSVGNVSNYLQVSDSIWLVWNFLYSQYSLSVYFVESNNTVTICCSVK